jgi:hypothetical protein
MENSLPLTGVILGSGFIAPCRVKVHVETGPYFAHSPFIDCAIEEAPCEFPVATYEVRFLNQAASLRHEQDRWTVGIPWETAT